jgi:hypothetical protein
MKKFILTIDYELFFGNVTGTVDKCIVEPTYNLAKILEISDSKMTVFWDILHYYRLTELENIYSDLQKDRKLIDEQILFLISKGHDIQLHIHPHWLDAEYSNGEWRFQYNRFKINELSKKDEPNKINTIHGCISLSKQLMENIIRKHYPEYKVTTYRAGGYLVEPFSNLKKAFENNDIYVDSSVLPGMINENNLNAYDFRNYPNDNIYKFENSPAQICCEGKFTEVPVTTVRIPVIWNIIFTIIRLLKYRTLEKKRLGKGSGDNSFKDEKSIIKRMFSLLTESKLILFTTDGNFRERLNYIFKTVPNNSNMILHPKLLNEHTLSFLEDKLSENDIQFISIKDFLNGK